MSITKPQTSGVMHGSTPLDVHLDSVDSKLDTILMFDVTTYGFIVGDDESLAPANTQAVLDAVEDAHQSGGCVIMPSGISYVNSIVLQHPVTIIGSHPSSGASLVMRRQASDIIHLGGGHCFDLPPKMRPDVPSSPNDVVDGFRLSNLNIRGTVNGLGGVRVNTQESIATVGYERRNLYMQNVNISGYYSGWGFELYNTYTNHLQCVTVWDCAATYYIRSAHSTDHISCVYENCAWGCLAINTECNNHIGGAIEGIRYLTKMNKPVNYDENGNFPVDTGYGQLYAGIGMRSRGGSTNLYGVYIEANKIDAHIEDSSKLTLRDCYVNAVAGRTDYHIIGTSGRLVETGNRFDGTPARERWHPNSATLRCSHAIIKENHFLPTAGRPTSTPTISNIGEFDVYPGTPDVNAVTRIMKNQNYLTSGSTTSQTLSVGGDVVLGGLTTTIPTVTGKLYIDSSGFVKWKQ